MPADVHDGDTSSIAKLIAGAADATRPREAIVAANNSAGNDTIDCSVEGNANGQIRVPWFPQLRQSQPAFVGHIANGKPFRIPACT